MAPNDELLYRELMIVNELGLHARSAAKLVKIAQQADKGVWLQLRDECVDAKQVIDLLTLAAAQGDRIKVTIEASADMAILDQIAELIVDGFGEQ